MLFFCHKSLNLLGKVVAEVFDIKNVTGRLTLIFPNVAVGVENTMAEQVTGGLVQLGTFNVVFKIVF